ncbi:MAG: hypothetical protein M3Q83_00555 [Pseudomonadota bacterium]|nr:hypothetical protein [Pseudomonadota bacterium]
MMGPGETMSTLIAILLPSLLIFYFARRFFQLKEKKLDIEALNAAEKAAQYVARSSEIEQRLAVIEQIVTDRGADTAAQIEALRPPRLSGGGMGR